MNSAYCISLIFAIANHSIAASINKDFCIGKQTQLHCPLQNPSSWKVKLESDKSSIQLALNEPAPRLIHRSAQRFLGLSITKNFSLVFPEFKTDYNGIYTCISRTKRLHYKVISTQCEVESCPGDKAVIECGILKYQRSFTEISWRDGRTIVVQADQNFQPGYENPRYKGVRLSPSGALVVPMNKTMDSKVFTCKLYDKNGATPRMSSTMLKIIKCTNNVTAEQNHTVNLECPYYKMLSTDPRASKLVWKKGSRKIVTLGINGQLVDSNVPSNVSVSKNGQISIKSISKRDMGTFICSVLQHDDKVLASHSVTLEVVTQPMKSSENVVANSRANWIDTSWPPLLYLGFCWLIMVSIT